MDIINKTLRKIHAQSKGRTTGFVIGNTSGLFKPGSFYSIPTRETDRLVYGGVIVKNAETAAKVARTVDGKVDYVFVDAEKKIEKIYYGKNDVGNIEQIVHGNVFKSKVITYKGNDLTIEAIDFLLGHLVVDLSGSRVAVIGSGNIGSKVALRLVERGAHVRVYRRDQKRLKKIVEGLNLIKSEHTISAIEVSPSIEHACRGASIVIASADKQGVVDEKSLALMDKNRPPILIDVGKGCFSRKVMNNRDYTIYRTDISIAQRHIFSALLESRHQYSKSIGKRILENNRDITLVSLGVLGNKGEIIVDDIDRPARIIGVADGNGALVKDINKYRNVITRVRTLFKIA